MSDGACMSVLLHYEPCENAIVKNYWNTSTFDQVFDEIKRLPSVFWRSTKTQLRLSLIQAIRPMTDDPCFHTSYCYENLCLCVMHSVIRNLDWMTTVLCSGGSKILQGGGQWTGRDHEGWSLGIKGLPTAPVTGNKISIFRIIYAFSCILIVFFLITRPRFVQTFLLDFR